MKRVVKLDIVSVEILTNIICVPVSRVFRKIHAHTLVHVVSAVNEVFVFKDCKNSHENI